MAQDAPWIVAISKQLRKAVRFGNADSIVSLVQGDIPHVFTGSAIGLYQYCINQLPASLKLAA